MILGASLREATNATILSPVILRQNPTAKSSCCTDPFLVPISVTGWQIMKMRCGHSIMVDMPSELAAVLDELA